MCLRFVVNVPANVFGIPSKCSPSSKRLHSMPFDRFSTKTAEILHECSPSRCSTDSRSSTVFAIPFGRTAIFTTISQSIRNYRIRQFFTDLAAALPECCPMSCSTDSRKSAESILPISLFGDRQFDRRLSTSRVSR